MSLEYRKKVAVKGNIFVETRPFVENLPWDCQHTFLGVTQWQSRQKILDGCNLIICLNYCKASKTIYERMNYWNKFVKYMPNEGLMYLV